MLPKIGSLFLSKFARCRRPNMPLLSSLRGLRLPRRLLTLTPTTVRMAIFVRHCSGRQLSTLALFRKGRFTSAKGCSMAKGLRKLISRSTHVRADKEFRRVHDDLSRPKRVLSKGENRYLMIVRDDFSRFMWVYFMRLKSDAAETFTQFLADNRATRFPSDVKS